MPERSCRICRTKAPKDSLTRWVVTSEGFVRDQDKHISGRGVYTDSAECEQKLLKGRRNG